MPHTPIALAPAATAILIGQPQTCLRLERQLDLMEQRPLTLGWVIAGCGHEPFDCSDAGPILGEVDQLEAVIANRRPALAIICLPAALKELAAGLRLRLRRMGVPDRFVPTLEDLVAGVGPRTHLDIDLAALLDRPLRSLDRGAVDRTIRDRVVLITGAGGSIGAELSRIVARHQPRRLVLVERAENALFEIDRQIARAWPELPRKALLHDVVDATATRAHFQELRPQVIFHAAAHKHVPMMEDHPAAAVDNNLFGTKSVADAAAAVGADRFVMVSTDKAVNPRSIMGATKRLAELYVQSLNRRSKTQFAMVRFGNVLGSSGSVLEIWAKEIAEGGPISVTDPAMTRYFMTIPEAAALVIQAAAQVDQDIARAEVFVLDMGEPVRIVDLARRFIELHGLWPRLPGEPSSPSAAGVMPVIYTGARPGEKLTEELAFDGESMLPTKHPQINIWTFPQPEDQFVDRMIRRLSSSGRSSDPRVVAAEIWSLLPGKTQAVAA